MAGKRVWTLVAGGLVAAGLAVTDAVPAGAGTDPIYDLEISNQLDGQYIGDDVYSATGAGQTVKKNIRPKKSRNFSWQYNNDGDPGDGVVIGTGNKPCFRARHLVKNDAGLNVTHGVVNGAPAEPAGSDWIALRIKAKGCAQPGDKFSVKIDVSPTGGGQDFDRIKAKVKVR